MDKSNNPIEQGSTYSCEYLDCGKTIDAQNVRMYFAKHDFYFCPGCFEKWADIQKDPEDIRNHTFYGLEEKYIEPHPNRFVLKKPEDETFEGYSERVTIEHDIKQNNRLKQEFREKMREYMNTRNINPNVKELNRNRFKKLKKQFDGIPAIDRAPKICPQCKNPKCGKAGFVYTSDGKYQRRKCMKCGFAYTEDWSE